MKLIHLPTGHVEDYDEPSSIVLLNSHDGNFIRYELPDTWRVRSYLKSLEWARAHSNREHLLYDDWGFVSNESSVYGESNAFSYAYEKGMSLPEISTCEFQYHVYDRWKMRVQNHLEAEPFAEGSSFVHGEEKGLAVNSSTRMDEGFLFGTPTKVPESSFESDVKAVLNTIESLLASKNKAYGNAALDPIRIFSKADSTDGLLIRIDDKLNRIKNLGITPETEDSVMDLIGYLVLLKISQKQSNAKSDTPASQKEGNRVPFSSEEVRAVLHNTGTTGKQNYVSTTTLSGADQSGSLESGKPF